MPWQDSHWKQISFLCPIGAALCGNNPSLLQSAFNEALKQGIALSHIREVILTSYLFDGYPTALEGFRMLDILLPNTASEGTPIHYTDKTIKIWRQRGTKLCRQIYGDRFKELMTRLNRWAPELKESMIIEGYGKVLARPQLDIEIREIVVITMLLVKQRPRQLISHIYGALRLNVPPDAICSTLTYAQPFIPPLNFQELRLKVLNTIGASPPITDK
ncbi:MAG: carboxymuconolactone decarboxylase family protein [bacterium]